MSDAKLKVGGGPPRRATCRQAAAHVRASAEALLANRPLRAVSSPPTQPASALAEGRARGTGRRRPLGRALAARASGRPAFADRRRLRRPDRDQPEHRGRGAHAAGRREPRPAAPARALSLRGGIRGRVAACPSSQFERRTVLPGLAAVLASLPAELNALEVAEWFLTRTPISRLKARDQPLSPREWLLGDSTGPSLPSSLVTSRRAGAEVPGPRRGSMRSAGSPPAVRTLAKGVSLARVYFTGGDHPTRWNEFRHLRSDQRAIRSSSPRRTRRGRRAGPLDSVLRGGPLIPASRRSSRNPADQPDAACTLARGFRCSRASSSCSI